MDGGPSSGTYGRPTLRAAVKAGDAAAARAALLKLGAGAAAALDATDGAGRAPLHVAAAQPKAAELVTALLEQGARCEARDAKGDTALTLALQAAAKGTAQEVVDITGVVSCLLHARAEVEGAWPQALLQAGSGRELIEKRLGEAPEV